MLLERVSRGRDGSIEVEDVIEAGGQVDRYLRLMMDLMR